MTFAVFEANFSISVVKTTATVVFASRIDYCKDLLFNIASNDILKLQCVRNYLDRVVTRSPRFSNSGPLLKSLLCAIAYQTNTGTRTFSAAVPTL